MSTNSGNETAKIYISGVKLFLQKGSLVEEMHLHDKIVS
jgi:hypothetical protein